MKILILCKGNSCRSQMAHGFLESFDERLDVYSAGTEPAREVNPRAVQVMKEAGIDISSHKPKPVGIYLRNEWDWVITVCDEADAECPFFTGKVRVRTHIHFKDPSDIRGSEEAIMNEFRRTRDLIRDGFYKLYSEKLKPSL